MKLITITLIMLALMVSGANAQLSERPDSIKIISQTGLMQLSKYRDYSFTSEEFKSIDNLNNWKMRVALDILDIGNDILNSNLGIHTDPFLRPESVSSYIFNYRKYRLLGGIPVQHRIHK